LGQDPDHESGCQLNKKDYYHSFKTRF
jgi:hypothetical protein